MLEGSGVSGSKGGGVGGGALLSMCIYNALFTANPNTPLLSSVLKESGIYEEKVQHNLYIYALY